MDNKKLNIMDTKVKKYKYIYILLDKSNNILYVGRTNDLHDRMSEHNHLSKEEYLEVEKVIYIINPFDYIDSEKYYINLFKPKFNKQGIIKDMRWLDYDDFLEKYDIQKQPSGRKTVYNKEAVWRKRLIDLDEKIDGYKKLIELTQNLITMIGVKQENICYSDLVKLNESNKENDVFIFETNNTDYIKLCVESKMHYKYFKPKESNLIIQMLQLEKRMSDEYVLKIIINKKWLPYIYIIKEYFLKKIRILEGRIQLEKNNCA